MQYLQEKELIKMVVERQNEDIVIRLNAALVDIRDVQHLVDPFRFIESVAKNQGTEEQAAELAREAEANWWKRNKQRFLPWLLLSIQTSCLVL